MARREGPQDIDPKNIEIFIIGNPKKGLGL